MVVDTMNMDEIVQELQRERINYSDITRWYDTACKARRTLVKMQNKRSDTPIYFPPKYYTTSNRNKLLVAGHCFGYKQYCKSGLTFHIAMFFRYNEELWAACWGADEDQLTVTAFYQPHLFQRYKERFLHNTSCLTQKAMEYFFSRNGISSISAQNNPKYPNGIFTVVEDGVLLGESYGTKLLYKTYISDTMLKGEQVSFAMPQKDNVLNTVNNQTPLHLRYNGGIEIKPSSYGYR